MARDGLPRNLDPRDRAARLFAEGLRPTAVARALGIARSTASEWRRRWLAAGAAGLVPRPPGPRARIPAATAVPLLDALLASPRYAGIDADAWSLAAVALLIERRTGIRYHRRHIGRWLRRAGVVIPPFAGREDRAMAARIAADPDGNPLRVIRRRG